MSGILRGCSNPRLARVIEAQWFEYFAKLASGPDAELIEDEHMKFLVSSIPHPMFNGVFYADFKPEDAERRIDETIDYFIAMRLPFTWHIGPSTSPPNLGQSLRARGIKPSASPGMAVDLSSLKETLPAPSGLLIEKVRDMEALGEWVKVLLTGFRSRKSYDVYFRMMSGVGLDGDWVMYIGYLNGEPVASSQLFLMTGVAGLYSVATIPKARRRGIGTAISLKPLLDGHAEGYKVGILLSSRMAYSMYRRMGFEEYCSIDRYTFWR